MIRESLEQAGLLKQKDDVKFNKDFKMNEEGLMQNLRVSEEELKRGVPLEEAINEAFLRFARMTQSQRNAVRDKLEPYPSRKVIRYLERLVKKYEKKSTS